MDDEARRLLRQLAWAAEAVLMSDVRDPDGRLWTAYEESERALRDYVEQRRSDRGVDRREPAVLE
jgi:hypothetical protein